MANKELKFGSDLVIVEYAKKDRLGNQIDSTYAKKTELPTVNNGTLTIQKNGTNVATFTANQSGNSTANISVPVNFSDLSSRGEAFLGWGGQSLSSNVSPIGMSLSSEHSANRLAFINGDALYVEYSSDNGSTWTDYGASKNNKSEFCTTSYSFNIGSNSSSTTRTTSMKTRITLTAQNGTSGYVYTSPKKMLIRMSTACGVSMLVEYRTGANYKSGGSWSTFGTYTVSGWSGWNDIPLILGTLGGGSSQTGNNWQLRMTFSVTSVSSSSPTYAQVIAMRIFGDNGWTTTSNMGNTGHLYSYDISQNATFPANVNAFSFVENGSTLSSKYLGKTDKASDSAKLNGQEASYYLNYNNLTNKPTIPSVGTLNTTATTSQSTSASESLGGSITLHKVAKTGSYDDLLNKPTIPSAVTESTVSGWGFTKNSGTITGITMNGASKGTSGVVDLGTVITSHQSLASCVKTSGDQAVAGTKTFSSSVNVSATNEIGAGTRAAYFGDGVVYLVGGTNQSLGFPLTGGTIATTSYVDDEIGTAITNVLNANYS